MFLRDVIFLLQTSVRQPRRNVLIFKKMTKYENNLKKMKLFLLSYVIIYKR